MKVGRISDSSGDHTVVFHNGHYHRVSTITGLPDDEIGRNFYSILETRKSEIENFLKNEETTPAASPDFRYLVPVPSITSIRDFYAFENHVKTARAKRGLGMIDEWYQIPVFYYSGTSNIIPSNEEISYPSYSSELDYELEVGIVIGKEGNDIRKEEAGKYSFGLLLMCDWSARDLQRREMKVGLGPSKSKDFATSTGQFIVTWDEVESAMDSNGRIDISLEAYVNGKLYSRGNLADIYWSIGSLIEWASTGLSLRPGDILMTGTVGTGCILELGPEKYGWLKRGDEVTFKSDRLGEYSGKVI